MPYGLLSTGYNPKPQSVVRDEMNASLRAVRGNSIDLSDGSLEGQLVGILSEREGLLWDLGQSIVAAADPDAATDAAQDAVCAITGTFRDEARASSVTETLTGVPATVVAAGSQVRTASTQKYFKTVAPATIAALTAWAPTTAYALGDRRTNASRVYQCITAGTSAGSGGPTTTAADNTDNTVHWRYLGEGTGAVDVAMTSVELDAIVALSGDLTSIQTPTGGWQGAINVRDATLGALEQTNESLRVTRESELAQFGTSTADAIRAAILGITGVVSCSVFENTTDVVDGNGQPAHSVQVLVRGGADADIAQVLYSNVAAGIATFGTTTVAVTDSEGVSHNYNFTRPTLLNIYIDISLKYNPASSTKGGYPSNGDALVKTALVNFGNTIQTGGKDVVPSSVGAAAFPVYVNSVQVIGVQGVLDVTDTRVYTDVIATPTNWAPTTAYVATSGARSVVLNQGRAYICITGGTSAGSGGPLGTGTDITDNTVHWYYLGNTITITPFQIAAFDTSRITVRATAGTV